MDNSYRSFLDFADWSEAAISDVHRDLWTRFASELTIRRQNVPLSDVARATEVAMRTAAIDTGAIEGLYQVDRGFTMCVALQALAWQHAMAERGEGVRELFAAQLGAYEMVLDAATRQMPVSEAWLRSLHEQICGAQRTYRVLTDQGWQQQELPLGRYKTLPNHVLLADGSVHAYAPVEATPHEMRRLLDQLRSDAFGAAHPILQVAYAHHAFVVIHPFTDGNGRVARALASVFFYRSLGVPFVVLAGQRSPYFAALEAADRGDIATWIGFVAERGIDTLQLVADQLRLAEAKRQQPDEIAELSAAYLGWGRRTGAEMDNLALRLLSDLQGRFAIALAAEGGARFERRTVAGDSATPTGYRWAAAPAQLEVYIPLDGARESAGSARLALRVAIAKDDSYPFALLVEEQDGTDGLPVRAADVAPEVSATLAQRLDWFVERQLRGTLASAAQEPIRASTLSSLRSQRK